ncbi:hypothetical protein [Altericroceibacterium xinjiangense]|uniref:hypothetical protein n=1 Tax=Altericroceibacterium xinjiangense TaxID=762261 RepID=UPI000F7DD9AF|nr:hypothetical protein [Altericroceibacterium xinjiangense]
MAGKGAALAPAEALAASQDEIRRFFEAPNSFENALAPYDGRLLKRFGVGDFGASVCYCRFIRQVSGCSIPPLLQPPNLCARIAKRTIAFRANNVSRTVRKSIQRFKARMREVPVFMIGFSDHHLHVVNGNRLLRSFGLTSN